MAEYAGLSLLEALELPVDLFMLCYKNSVTEKLMQTEEGREYLDDCARYKQAKPDKAGLHRLMGKLGR